VASPTTPAFSPPDKGAADAAEKEGLLAIKSDESG
jgi:hypothetical protein